LSKCLLYVSAVTVTLHCVLTVCQALRWVLYTHFLHSFHLMLYINILLFTREELRHREIKSLP
jgi:hypothetical protein